MRNAKKFKKDPCGGGVALRTLTEDSDSGLQLRTPISEKCQKNLRRTRVVAAAAVFFVIIKPTLVLTSTSTWTSV